jgi:hypothetical protein
LTKHLGLPAEFSEKLNPYVRGKYLELWEAKESDVEEEWSSGG